MKTKISQKKGYSIIEMIFVVFLVVILLFTLTNIYFRFYKSYSRQQTGIEISGSAHSIGNELQISVLQANEIISSHDFFGTTYSTDQDTLVLELPSIDASKDTVSGKFDYVVFYLDGTILYKQMEADVASTRTSGLDQISADVSTLLFTYDNPDLAQAEKIDAEIGVQKMTGGQTVSYDFHQIIYLRNL